MHPPPLLVSPRLFEAGMAFRGVTNRNQTKYWLPASHHHVTGWRVIFISVIKKYSRYRITQL
jgi:hypothetical protein